MARIREVTVDVPVVITSGDSGGTFGVVGVMAAAFSCVVLVALAALVWVLLAYPRTDYSTTVPTTRQLGPCEPFCSLRTTTSAPGVTR
jgi:hypothetical protein